MVEAGGKVVDLACPQVRTSRWVDFEEAKRLVARANRAGRCLGIAYEHRPATVCTWANPGVGGSRTSRTWSSGSQRFFGFGAFGGSPETYSNDRATQSWACLVGSRQPSGSAT